jgi:hypothetical protein
LDEVGQEVKRAECLFAASHRDWKDPTPHDKDTQSCASRARRSQTLTTNWFAQMAYTRACCTNDRHFTVVTGGKAGISIYDYHIPQLCAIDRSIYISLCQPTLLQSLNLICTNTAICTGHIKSMQQCENPDEQPSGPSG